MAYRNGPLTVTNGLILSFDASDKNSYTGSGDNIIRNLSTVYYTGSLNNGAIYSSENNIDFWICDGTNDFVLFEPNTLGSATDNYTFELFYKPNGVATDKASYAFGRGRDGSGNGWSLSIGLEYNAASLTYRYRAAAVPTAPSTVGLVISGSETASTSSWVHLTGVWEAGSKLQLYVNGTLKGTLNTTGTTLRSSTVGWTISTISSTLYSPLSASIARVYNRVLSADEIQQNYDAQKSRFGLP